MRQRALFMAWSLFLCTPLVAAAQPAGAAAEDAEHEKLRGVRTGLVDAYNKGDLDKLLSFCHPKIIATWQNGEVTTGREGLRAYYEKMLVGKDAVVKELVADPKVDDVSTIYGGNMAIARGAMNDKYKLNDGSDFAMNSRWSATLVKENEEWLVAAFHASANVFDNGILWMATKRTMWTAGGIAVAVGLALGILFGRMTKRGRADASGWMPNDAS